MNHKKCILKFFSLDRSNLLKFSLGFLLNLVLILIFSILSLFILYLITMITYKSVIWFVGLIFGAKISLKISLLVLLIILLKLQGRRRYAKYFDAKLLRYIKKQDKDGLNKYKMILMMLGVYISISVLGLVVYRVSGNELSTSNKSDLINIFIWATYLIAPVVAIWVFNNWKVEFRDRERYKAFTHLKEILNKSSLVVHKVNEEVGHSWDQKIYEISTIRYSTINPHHLYPDVFIKKYELSDKFIKYDNYQECLVRATSNFFEVFNNLKNNSHNYDIVLIEIEVEFKNYLEKLECIKSELTPYSILFTSDYYEIIANKFSIFQMDLWIKEMTLNKDNHSCNLKEFDEMVEDLKLKIQIKIDNILI